ncbi:conserved hypothetical protein [Gammaproteobacteria bacterium]
MLHPTRQLLGVLLAGTLLVPIHGATSEDLDQSPTVESFSGAIAFTPPNRGAPARRIGGGSRGDKTQLLMSALVPPQTGLTSQTQPILYWFISQAVNTPLDLAITVPNEENPVLEIRLPSPSRPGIQGIDLAKLGIKLKPDVEYQWSVSLVNDDTHRSADTFVAGSVVRTTDGNGGTVDCRQHGRIQQATAYAAQGLWYDALQCLNQLVDQKNTPEHRLQRGTLLAQGDLKAIAQWLETHP